MHVIYTAQPVLQPPTETTPVTWTWIGRDDRDLELEADSLLVIHVMPYDFRRNR